MDSDNTNNNKRKQPDSSSSSSLLTATANDPIMKSSSTTTTTSTTTTNIDDDDDKDHCNDDTNDDDDDDDDDDEDEEEEKEIKYVEFYSGIGGWTMALQESLDRLGPLLKLSSSSSSSSSSIPSSSSSNNNNNSNSHRHSRRSCRYKLKRLAALDHSDLCVQVFSHNFNKKKENENKEDEDEEVTGGGGETLREKQRREKQKRQKQQRNGQQQDKTTFSIERLSIHQIEEWSADIWCMSPPCQPHTRQHDNNTISKDVDPRSKSFLKICEWLDSKKNKDSNDSDSDGSNDSDDNNNNKSNKSKSNNNNNTNYCLQDKYLPSLIFLENVIGFEVSTSFERWTSALQSRNYFISNFHLSPTQINIPNDRPRYYCIAIRGLSLSKQNQNLQIQIETATPLSSTSSSSLSQDVPSAESLLSYFSKMDNNNNNNEENMNIGTDENTTTATATATAPATTTFKPPVPPRIWKSIPELLITSSEDAAGTISKRTTGILPISSFLDNNQNNRSPLSSSSSKIPIRREDLYVPEKVLKNKSSWCFDIVCPTDHRSSCFTHSYGRYIKGTGSILYENDDVHEKLLLLPPSEREFCSNWMKELKIDGTKLRYFSGSELARLFGFPTTKFVFPSQITNKQQWKLIGNSLNVGIASKLIDLGFLLRYYYHNNEEEDEDEHPHQHQQQQQKQQQQQNNGV